MTNPKSFRINPHVERMRRYVPLDAGADQLVHELVDVEEAANVTTRAEATLLRAVESPDLCLVLLTGDAGHGKTRLCCQLLERLDFSPRDAADAIRERANGEVDLAALENGRCLRIVKDLSDFDPDDGAALVADALAAPDRITIMCVNEGRLRDIVSRRPGELAALLNRLEQGLVGDTERAADLLIVNLNFQSVAALEGSLVEGLLQQWVGDGRRWRPCTDCGARDLCPIYENRRLLSDPAKGDSRAARWADLLRTAERMGFVVTIRELLVTVAFALTGGLRCADVHERVESGAVDRRWQWRFLYFQGVFEGIQALERTSPGLRTPRAMQKLDPGRYADRRIDENLVVDHDGPTFRPLDPTGDLIGIDWRDQSVAEKRVEQLALIRFLRRRAFFDDQSPAASPRVGLRFGDLFQRAVEPRTEQAPREVRDRVVRGLAAVQGLANTGDRLSALPIVEPALAGRSGGVSILDRDIRLAEIRVTALSSAWAHFLGRPPALLEQVDWVERSAAVIIEGQHLIEMDLRAFELVCAAGEGLDLMSADPGVARRLLLQLAGLTGSRASDDRIDIIESGQRWKVDLDLGDQLIGTRA